MAHSHRFGSRKDRAQQKRAGPEDDRAAADDY